MTRLLTRYWPFAVLALSIVIPLRALPQQSGSASVEGIVVKLGTNEPIPGAVVELSRPASTPNTPPEILKTATGDDGKFAFRSVIPGEYRMVATRQRR
jgi:Carboxypeptidase regulatory-like domain